MLTMNRALCAPLALSALLLVACTTTSNTADGGDAAPATKSQKAAKAEVKEAKVEAKADARAEREADMVEGTPAPHSKFPRVRIGMGMREVMDLVGAPTDQGAYVTGKAFIPFYFGRDTYRHELLYKGQGRLIFSGGNRYAYNTGRLIRIIHNADERGYR